MVNYEITLNFFEKKNFLNVPISSLIVKLNMQQMLEFFYFMNFLALFIYTVHKLT